LIYLVSPLIALHSIRSAVQSKDAVALTDRIDFPALRRSLTKQIVAEYLKLTGKKLPLHAMGKRLAVSAADPVIVRLMAVRAMLDLLGKGDAGEKAKLPIERAPFTSTSFESLWQVWLNCDYRGRDFYVSLPPKNSKKHKCKKKGSSTGCSSHTEFYCMPNGCQWDAAKRQCTDKKKS
jgi:hypothetical protein